MKTQNPQISSNDSPQARRYQQPALRLLGDVRTITEGGSGAVMETNTMCEGMTLTRQKC